MSLFAFDPELEQKLNDIDEFIRSQCGEEFTDGFDQSEWILPSQTAGEVPPPSSSWNIKAEASLPVPCGFNTNVPSKNPYSKDFRPDVRVQIFNLMDIYDKRIMRMSEDYEYRLGPSEVTIVAHAAEEIKRVRVFIQRCPEAEVRTEDTTGPVELEVDLQHHDHSQTVLTVDLGSVYRTEEGNEALQLEKADITERNEWELVIIIGFRTGVITTVKSKPFIITTRTSQMYNTPEHDTSDAGEDDVQRVPSHCCEEANYSATSSHFSEIPEESFDTHAVVNRVASKLRHELAKVHLHDEIPSPTQTVFRTDPLVLGKVVLRPDTTLDKKKVSTHYNRDIRTRYVVEQPDIPVLLKLMSRKATCTSSGRRRANGFKTAEEDFWWACGLCFFERRKKSTVKAHVAQRVCQKTSLRKEMRQRRKEMRHLKRYSSCEFNTEELEGFERFTWNSPLSV